ncbi:hypothetical protein AVEN_17193-1 [Araneus ventricosus]|uniref:Uncharacterized protein n=1 Tax=Araneus ventricosus TaxID=182803 RepID=A0A4Y2DTR8_ARAVE|nr:hypothetical protein AVEN_17193-1 [Araneus ventricosus]
MENVQRLPRDQELVTSHRTTRHPKKARPLRCAPLLFDFGNSTLFVPAIRRRLVSKRWRAAASRRRILILRKDRVGYVNKYPQIVIV